MLASQVADVWKLLFYSLYLTGPTWVSLSLSCLIFFLSIRDYASQPVMYGYLYRGINRFLFLLVLRSGPFIILSAFWDLEITLARNYTIKCISLLLCSRKRRKRECLHNCLERTLERPSTTAQGPEPIPLVRYGPGKVPLRVIWFGRW